ncbi:MAG: carbamoyltransferase HypF, partial [bacterium]
VGGFHLACDATNRDAVNRLRQRKGRGNKPLALMVRNIESAERLVSLTELEKKSLGSVQAPILLLRPRKDLELQAWIAPDSPRLGVMLPYSPLHHLLCAQIDRPLVMTSGNLSEEPLAFENQEALRRLENIADTFLIHDRPIARACDDSVAVVWRDRLRLMRRSRGYVPRPLPLPDMNDLRPFLCMGADLKNTFCLVTQDGMAFPSQHIGDLESPESQRNFRDSLRDLCQLLDVCPEAVVVDPHPNYHSTRLAAEVGKGLPVYNVQHHEAHFAGCLAENDFHGSAIGISWDGTGYGTDDLLWGGEFFVGDAASLKRAATFRPCKLPGGEQAIHEPWRVAYAWMLDIYGSEAEERLPPGLHTIPEDRRKMVRHILERGINCPACTSVGRLFDAVASIVGLRQTVTYEAEAAVALEACQADGTGQAYPFALATNSFPWVIDTEPMLRTILDDVFAGTAAPEISARFHWTLALICREVCWKLRSETGLDRVALSGGVFQNFALLESVSGVLESEKFSVLTHSEVPPNDGGISYGQAAAAAARWRQCVWQYP